MRTIDILQVLRFVAAALVVIYHIQPDHRLPSDFESLFSFVQKGGSGVDIFFVISGFIITLAATRKPVFNARDFALNRFFRIYPTYWLFLTLAILLGYISYRLTGSSGTYELVEPSSLFVSYLLLPLPTQIFPVAWTLTLEITFYLLFCLSYSLGGLRAVVVALLGWYAVARLLPGIVLGPDDPFIWFFHSVVLEFLYGVVIAILWQRKWIVWPGLVFAVGCVAYAGVVTGAFEIFAVGREFKWGIPAALLVYGAVSLPWKAPRWAVLAGDSSYILYLMHPLLITVIKVLGLRLFGINTFENNIAAVLILVLAVVISMGLTYWIERPYVAWYKRLIAPRRAPEQTQTGTSGPNS